MTAMKRYLALASAATLLVMSCQPPQQVTVDVYRLEGNVTVPQDDQSIKAEKQAAIPASLNPIGLLMPAAEAATGLKAIDAGVEVRLIRIDNEGRPISGEPLVTTRTDVNGHYSMDVRTADITLPSTQLVLEVGNYATGNYMRTFAIQQNLDINPVTTAVVQLLVDRSEPLYSMPVTVVQEAWSLANQGTSSLNYASTNLANSLSNTLSSLKANATLSTRLDQLLTRVVSGKVLAPNGRLAAAPMRIDSFFMPDAEALTGLQAVSSNITVTLSRIDNNGNVVGAPLAITKTQSDGSYALVLPTEAQLSSEFVVSVGSGPSLMRSMLSGSAQLDISPLSEMTTRLVLENGTVLNQPKIPISQFSAPEINAILDSVQRATSKTSLGGAGTLSAVLSLIDPVVKNDSVVRNNLGAAGGIPAPAVNSIAPVTALDTVTLTGTARSGSLVTVEGGTQVVSQSLATGATDFSIVVPLKRNSNHELAVRSTLGSDASLPNIVKIRTDTLNPRIVTDKIIARNPNTQSFDTIITGSTGAIDDQGRSTILISGPKLGNVTRIQTNETGAFEAHLAADTGDVLNLSVVDEANNRAEGTIVVGGPGPVITTVMQESTISRDAPFADRVITVQGAGFDADPAKNFVTFTALDGSTASSAARSVATDRRSMVVPVPTGLASKLSQLPTDVKVQVSVNNIASNTDRAFTLFPKVEALTASKLSGNGLSEFIQYDTSRQNVFMTTQLGADSSILSLDANGNVQRRNIADKITHDSIFRDLTFDNNNNLLTSNFDALLAGKNHDLPGIRPTYRVSQYQLQGAGAELVMASRLSESADLGAEPGAIAFSKANNKIYVAIPSQGKILKLDFTGGQFTRPEILVSGLPTPIRDIELDADGRFMYISLGQNLSVFRMTLNAAGDLDLLNSNFARDLGNGSGHLTVDAERNLYVSLGTGIERLDEKGKRRSLISILEGQQPTVGVVQVNGRLFTNQLNKPDLFRISP